MEGGVSPRFRLRGDVEGSIEIFSAKVTRNETKGKLFYHEGSQAWNVIRLKKEILEKFPHLKQKVGNFVYLMKCPDSYKELKQEIEYLEKKKAGLPIILFLGEEKIINEE